MLAFSTQSIVAHSSLDDRSISFHLTLISAGRRARTDGVSAHDDLVPVIADRLLPVDGLAANFELRLACRGAATRRESVSALVDANTALTHPIIARRGERQPALKSHSEAPAALCPSCPLQQPGASHPILLGQPLLPVR